MQFDLLAWTVIDKEKVVFWFIIPNNKKIREYNTIKLIHKKNNPYYLNFKHKNTSYMPFYYSYSKIKVQVVWIVFFYEFRGNI